MKRRAIPGQCALCGGKPVPPKRRTDCRVAALLTMTGDASALSLSGGGDPSIFSLCLPPLGEIAPEAAERANAAKTLSVTARCAATILPKGEPRNHGNHATAGGKT